MITMTDRWHAVKQFLIAVIPLDQTDTRNYIPNGLFCARMRQIYLCPFLWTFRNYFANSLIYDSIETAASAKLNIITQSFIPVIQRHSHGTKLFTHSLSHEVSILYLQVIFKLPSSTIKGILKCLLSGCLCVCIPKHCERIWVIFR